MSRFYVYIATSTERTMFYHEDLSVALKKYLDCQMKTFTDNVFLGYEDLENHICLDILHKFFDEHILINDYLNHQNNMDLFHIVLRILDTVSIKYQFSSAIWGGVLIDYSSHFISYKHNYELACLDSKQKCLQECYISTLKDNDLQIVGWVDNDRESSNSYGWSYPTIASYITLVSVTVRNKHNSSFHTIDMDIRAYLELCNEHFSNRRELI